MSATPTDGNDGGQLVEVDFTAHRQPLSLANDLQTQVNAIKRDLATAESWQRWKEGYYRHTIRLLRQQLAKERAVNEPSQSDVLEALAGFHEPVAASELAARLYRRPSHSVIVRIGLALVRLEAEGLTVRVPVRAHGENRNRWHAVNAC